MEGPLQVILSFKYFIYCILLNIYALLCMLSESIYGGKDYFFKKKNNLAPIKPVNS